MQGMKFNQDGITAILEDRKTNSRRPVKQVEVLFIAGDRIQCMNGRGKKFMLISDFIDKFSKYKIGETVFVQSSPDEYFTSEMTKDEASIFLKITNIKVERLQDISDEDCIKEGFHYTISPIGNCFRGAVMWFEDDVWNNLPYQAPYGWDSNPYVFVYEFEVVK